MRKNLLVMTWVWASAIVLGAFVFVACGGGGSAKSEPPPAPTSTTVPEDAEVTAKTFTNLASMTKVGRFYVDNLNGHDAETIAVAKAGTGVYPVGSLVQLFPTEAMVKRQAGFSPATGDWEFFELEVSDQGTTIHKRGGSEIVNRFGGSCSGCHMAADPDRDFICGKNHGCEPLPAILTEDLIKALQLGDPRPK